MSHPRAHLAPLVERARRQRRKGDMRGMLVTLRQACARDESAAWLWTLYGALAAQHGQVDDARRALKHALWLRRQAGDAPRAASTQRLLRAACNAA
jgi:hypothetical protein